MIGTEITISLIVVHVLQALSLPLQVLAQVKKGRSKSSDQFFVLSIIFLGCNSAFLFYGFHLKDDFGIVLCVKTLLIYVLSYFVIAYLKERVSLKIETGFIHLWLLLLVVLIFSKSLLADFILPSKLFQIKMLFITMIQLVVAVFILRVIPRVNKLKESSSLEEKMILLLLFVLSFSPLLFEIVGNQLIRSLFVNIVFFSLFMAHFIDLSNRLKAVLQEKPIRQNNHYVGNDSISVEESTVKNEVDLILEPFDLSNQQLVVLKLVVQGKNYREVSTILYIAHSTARKHGTNIYEKVGVNGLKSLRKKFKDIDLSSLPDYEDPPSINRSL